MVSVWLTISFGTNPPELDMIVSGSNTLEAFMHGLLLVLLAPFALLFAGLALVGLTLLAFFALELPLVFLGVVGLGLFGHHLAKLTNEREVACE